MSIEGILQGPYRAIAKALEVIPRTLIQNCGGSSIRQITSLRAKHAQNPDENWTWGVNGITGPIIYYKSIQYRFFNLGELADIKDLGVWDPLSVRIQVLKTAVETSLMLLRIDDILSGTKKKSDSDGSGAQGPVNPE
jgi:T-complex protein 1 subunit gamma